MKYYVYKLTWVGTNKVYIGCTKRPSRRLEGHTKDPKWQKMWISPPKMTILDEFSDTEYAKLSETWWISYYFDLGRCLNSDLMSTYGERNEPKTLTDGYRPIPRDIKPSSNALAKIYDLKHARGILAITNILRITRIMWAPDANLPAPPRRRSRGVGARSPSPSLLAAQQIIHQHKIKRGLV